MSQRRKVPGSIAIPSDVPPNMRKVFAQIKESLDVVVGHRGDPLDRSPSLRELIDGGVVERKVGGGVAGGYGAPTVEVDATALQPETPVDVTVTATSRYMYVNWSRDRGAVYTEIWLKGPSATAPSAGSSGAYLAGTSTATAFSVLVEPEQFYRVFVRHVGVGGKLTAYHEPEGSVLQVGADPKGTVDDLQDELLGLELTPTPVPEIKTGVDSNGKKVLVLGADRIVMLAEDDTVLGSAPFYIDTVDGEQKIIIDGALIKEASIGSAAFGELTADDIATGTLDGITLTGNEIIGGSVTVGGGNGIETVIDSDGFRMTSATNATDGYLSIDNDTIAVFDSAGNVRVKIGNLN